MDKKKTPLEEFDEKTRIPLIMLELFGKTQGILAEENIEKLIDLMKEVTPLISEAIQDKGAQLEALYRAAIIQNHYQEIIIKKLKEFYVANLLIVRDEIDEKIRYIKTLSLKKEIANLENVKIGKD